MKALSLLQPWASLVVSGAKKIETRSWQTAYRGPLLIHASKGKSGALLATEPPFKNFIPDFTKLPFGAIIGTVELVDIVRITFLGCSNERLNRLTLEERAFGDYTESRYAWLLEDAATFEKPIPCNGALQLWEYSGPL